MVARVKADSKIAAGQAATLHLDLAKADVAEPGEHGKNLSLDTNVAAAAAD